MCGRIMHHARVYLPTSVTFTLGDVRTLTVLHVILTLSNVTPANVMVLLNQGTYFNIS